MRWPSFQSSPDFFVSWQVLQLPNHSHSTITMASLSLISKTIYLLCFNLFLGLQITYPIVLSSDANEFDQRLNTSKATSTSEMVKSAAVMQTTSPLIARGTSSIPASEPIPYKAYSPLGIGLFAVALFLILVAGTALIYYKDRYFCHKRKGDAKLRQDTHLAEATNREQDPERGSAERQDDAFQDIPLDNLRQPSEAHISVNPSPLTWVRFLGG